MEEVTRFRMTHPPDRVRHVLLAVIAALEGAMTASARPARTFVTTQRDGLGRPFLWRRADRLARAYTWHAVNRNAMPDK